MKIREIKEKSSEELEKILGDLGQKRQELNFKISNKQITNVREIRLVKKNMAQIVTVLAERKSK